MKGITHSQDSRPNDCTDGLNDRGAIGKGTEHGYSAQPRTVYYAERSWGEPSLPRRQSPRINVGSNRDDGGIDGDWTDATKDTRSRQESLERMGPSRRPDRYDASP